MLGANAGLLLLLWWPCSSWPLRHMIKLVSLEECILGLLHSWGGSSIQRQKICWVIGSSWCKKLGTTYNSSPGKTGKLSTYINRLMLIDAVI